MRVGCCTCTWLIRKGDTKEDARMKTILFPFALFVGIAGALPLYATLNEENQKIIVIGTSLVIAAALVFSVGVVFNVAHVGKLLDAFMGLTTVGLCCIDLGNATLSFPFRAWTIIVLVLDMALVFKRDHMPGVLVPFVLVYITAESLESFQSFGLYELGYWGTVGTEISFCNCASPPCSDEVYPALRRTFYVCIVFLGDFYFTRGFATGMRLQ
eukprot:Hpha_TRINITY_DN16204_c0_g4::TRINITY_DN16204_c0_g4_i1::g.15174::m.15174